MANKKYAYAFILILAVVIFAKPVEAWSNGGYSENPAQPDYGTHDWIAEHALDWLPQQEKQYLIDNKASYLYGTELPDNNEVSDGIGDTGNHHFYYFANGTVQDDAAANRAAQMYQAALGYLDAEDFGAAAKAAGIMSHYLVDVAVWAHVMGASTNWGSETGNNHANFEAYVNGRTSEYVDDFNMYLSYDGSLKVVSAYNATKQLANNTTFDNGQLYNCTWMNQNYDVDNSAYWERAGESLNLAVNFLTDVLHTLYLEAELETPPIPEISATGILTALIIAFFIIALLKQKP